MIIVTGGAGFIGANIVEELNKLGRSDIIIVDNLENSKKHLNLNNLDFVDFIDKRDFYNNLEDFENIKIEAIFHQGACSNTMEYNGRYMIDNNYQYSKKLLHFALNNNIRFIYASSAAVYGDGKNGFKEETYCEFPLNVYGYSKLIFDNYVRRILKIIEYKEGSYDLYYNKKLSNKKENKIIYKNENIIEKNIYKDKSLDKKVTNYLNDLSIINRYIGIKKIDITNTQIVGLRYFNVYGPYENHKGKMASVVYHFFNQIIKGNKIKLFEGSENFKRDFIFVKDIVDINIFFFKHPEISGIFNCGTGNERSFLDIAKIINSIYPESEIEYIPFPEVLKGKYQAFTKANINKLKNAGYKKEFYSLEEGVKQYIDYLEKNKNLL